jgi:transglutaminase-like putative cysteine protease
MQRQETAAIITKQGRRGESALQRTRRIMVPAMLGGLLAFVRPALADEPSNYQVQEQIRALAIASPYRISDAARAGKIRYRLHVDGEDWIWPETGEQHVEHSGDDIVLTICADCGREPPPTAAELARYRTGNASVQSTDPRVAAFAHSVPAGKRVDRRMSALVLAVQKHMNGAIDFRGYKSAREALDSRSGDCTEFAVLLAAVARARGIAARVVTGVAYSSRFVGRSHTFGPHTWVQAWDGTRWVSYDAALGRFDAGHIAIAVGDGSLESQRGMMQRIARLHIVDAAGLLPAQTVSSASP